MLSTNSGDSLYDEEKISFLFDCEAQCNVNAMLLRPSETYIMMD